MSADLEAERIRNEYRRRERDIASDYYSLHRPENLFFRHGQERALLDGLRSANLLPLADQQILEIGCGRGQWLGVFEQFGATPNRLAGVELDETRFAVAHEHYPEADIRCGNATSLPWPDTKFDVVLQSTVFTSILDAAVRTTVAREMLRVLKPAGAVLWYDFSYDNPRNPHVRGIGRREIRRLFPNCRTTFRRVTLAPPLARAIVPHCRPLATFLESLKILNTHLAAVIQPL